MWDGLKKKTKVSPPKKGGGKSPGAGTDAEKPDIEDTLKQADEALAKAKAEEASRAQQQKKRESSWDRCGC